MQAEPDSNSHLNNKGDVDGINFRPSSNFKHMRKYRKGAVAGEAGGGETSGTRSEEDSAGECQPPLPRDPPPPDSPLLTLKMEVKDEDYQESDEQSSSDLSLDNSNPKRNMCRDFARGACPYGDKCRFAHEIIVSQLPGVYTFCKDFQNSICKYQGQCKFVHATVFEKELFFRTGYLPPHAIAHMQPAEAPGPSAPPTEGGLAEAAAVYHSCPIPGGPVVHPGVSGVAGGGAEARPSADALAATAAIPAFPREWRDMDDLGAAAAREAARPAEPKKCRVCDISMYRYQCAKNRLEKAQRSSQELEKKKAALAVKLAKQRLILNAIQAAESSGLPVAGPSTSNSKGANLFTNSNFRKWNETEKTSIIEKLFLLLARNEHAPAVEEPSKALDQFSVILRLLSGESPPPPRHPPGSEPGPPPPR